MMEYTFAATISVGAAAALDYLLRTRILRTKRFWIFMAVMFGFKTIVNGYLTWRPIVLYGEGFFLGVRVFTIPLEDYLYGFALMTVSVVLWEYLRRRAAER
jgi:lycopene cyclase domain-containing protein